MLHWSSNNLIHNVNQLVQKLNVSLVLNSGPSTPSNMANNSHTTHTFSRAEVSEPFLGWSTEVPSSVTSSAGQDGFRYQLFWSSGLVSHRSRGAVSPILITESCIHVYIYKYNYIHARTHIKKYIFVCVYVYIRAWLTSLFVGSVLMICNTSLIVVGARDSVTSGICSVTSVTFLEVFCMLNWMGVAFFTPNTWKEAYMHYYTCMHTQHIPYKNYSQLFNLVIAQI